MMHGARRGGAGLALALGLACAAALPAAADPAPIPPSTPTLTVFHGTHAASGNVRLPKGPGLIASPSFKRSTSQLFKGKIKNMLREQLYQEGTRYIGRCWKAPLVTVSRYRSDGWATLSFVGIRFAPGTAARRCSRDGSYWVVLHLGPDLANNQPGNRYRGVLSGAVGAAPACADLAAADVPAEVWGSRPCLENGTMTTYAGPLFG